MRYLPLILLPLLLACGDDSPSEPDGPKDACPDQAYADLNLLFGRLADVLYYVDVAQMLLPKGASNRFTTTVADHDSIYSRQEIYDLISAATLGRQYADSVRTLMNGIENAADTLDPDEAWSGVFRGWRRSVDEALAFGDTTFRRTREYAAAIAAEVAPHDSLPSSIALGCSARETDPGFDGLAAFVDGADDGSWIGLLPSFVACASPLLLDGWAVFARDMVAAVAGRERPLLGPIARNLLPELLAAEPGWPSIERWANATGAILLDLTGGGRTGPALALLVAEGEGGAAFHPFFQSRTSILGPVPPGAYRVLVLSSDARPAVSPSFTIADRDTATVSPETTPLVEEECTLSGGDVTLWVIDASNDEHVANDFDLKCKTEVWTGTAIFQVEVPDAPGVRLRSAGTFSLVVDCEDQSIDGGGAGMVTVERADTAQCAPADPGALPFVFQVNGLRSLEDMKIIFAKEPLPLLVEVTCPSGSAFTRDVTAQIFPDREVTFIIGSARHASNLFPASATPESPAYIFTEVNREF
ncbi:MAG: hypothetical protein ABIK65_04535 [Candidatus Eisenbacteria bacterium]